ncbi:hypothetical protein WN944_014063 [Citrus x changshan-huyou]|uniref:Uncharacterized protein n=1 Tax=Citrus x changshan-huyou TaxID=2935761 RepID=A0AAP0QPQ0_9ROSI
MKTQKPRFGFLMSDGSTDRKLESQVHQDVSRITMPATTIAFPRPRQPTHWSEASPQPLQPSRKSYRTRPLSQTPSHAAATFSTITGGDSQSLTSSSEAVEPPPSHHHRQTPSITSSSIPSASSLLLKSHQQQSMS